MAFSSSVPSIDWNPSGPAIPQESDILAGVQEDLDAAFGGGLNPNLETPQGQLASSFSAIIADKNNQLALIANMIDPQYSKDRWQDAIGRIYFLTRKPATSTTVSCTLTGISGTTIPAGTLARDTSGNTYALTSDAVIPSTGSIAAQFQNIDTGPIACPAGTLTQVYQAIAGWDAITNAADGVLGQDAESRADFEFRRKNSVAINAHGSTQAIYGAVFDVENVLDVYVYDNPGNSAVEMGVTSYSVAPHSVYVAVVGGSVSEIARAIWSKKSLGCNTNGNTSVSVMDDSGYAYPQPSYEIKFEVPSPVPINFAVSIVNNPLLPSNITTLVQAAIQNRFNGADGSSRERIGSNVYASRYYGAIAAVDSNVQIISVQVGISTADRNDVAVGIDQSPTPGTITVTLV